MAIATSTFTGFRPEAIDFLADLAANNERDWFNPRKADYERLLKEPIEALVAALAERLAARDIPLRADPKRSIFRIYRDTRFSKDKSPYKTHLGASFPWLERAADGSLVEADGSAHANGGYFNFQPGEMYVGGGMWMAEKPRLDAFRRAIVDDPDRVRAALEEPGFVAAFGSVTRPRAPQARPARVARGPPDGRPVPLQGRRLRPAPVRRRGAVAVAARHTRRRLRRGDAGLPVPRDRPRVSARCGSGQPSGSIGPSGRACSTRAGSPSGPAGTALWIDDHLLADEGDPDRRQARGLDDARRARGPDPARPARPARGGQHVPEPGPDGQARHDASITSRADGPSSASEAAGSSSSTRPSASISARASATGWTGSTRRPDSSGACSTARPSPTTGRYYSMHEAVCAPRPVQPRMPILIGGSGPTKTLRTTAPVADLWNGYGRPSGSPRWARSCGSGATRSAARSTTSSGP